MSRKKWTISQYDKELAAEIAEAYALDPFAALLLVSRGLNADSAEDFLFAEGDMCDPFCLPDMEKAVNRIRKAVDAFEKIAIFGDYDADGITATAVLYQYLEANGANVMCYIPDRIAEGYGVTEAAIAELHKQGVSLIITVDNGIACVEEAAFAKTLSVDMVITDHHKQNGALPDAVAVVDPQRSDCTLPFRDWAGVGVAFKVICALENDNSEELLANFADLITIGTLADVVPLCAENRAIVREGMRYLNNSTRAGILALREVAGAKEKTLSASGVAYTLAPRINAAGRMGSAMTALKLLLSEQPDTALELAGEIDAYNKQRQATENEITAQAVACIEQDESIKYAPVLVVSGEGWHPGVLGIVAARLVGRYGKPAVVIATEKETGKGSCRSLGGFSVFDALCAVSETLTHFGGHTLAAGLGIQASDIQRFRTAINRYAQTIEMPFASVCLDCKLNPAYINNELLHSIALLEPYGAENPEPCFGLFKMQLTGVIPIGEGKHLKLHLRKGNTEIQAVLFSVQEAQFPYRAGDFVDAAVKIVPNEYRGEVKPSVQIKELRFSGTDEDNYLKSMRLFEKYRYGAGLNQKEIDFITPDRAFLLAVYKFIKKNSGWRFDTDVFCVRARCPLSSAATVCVAFDVLCELHLIEKQPDGTYSLVILDNNQKVDLESSEILADLNSRKGES